MQSLAEQKGCTAAQLALAWVLSRGDHVVSIPGTRSLERLAENAAAADVTLSEAELAELDAILPPDAAAGGRYPAQAMSLLNG